MDGRKKLIGAQLTAVLRDFKLNEKMKEWGDEGKEERKGERNEEKEKGKKEREIRGGRESRVNQMRKKLEILNGEWRRIKRRKKLKVIQ